jgi:hypothetical protein
MAIASCERRDAKLAKTAPQVGTFTATIGAAAVGFDTYVRGRHKEAAPTISKKEVTKTKWVVTKHLAGLPRPS